MFKEYLFYWILVWLVSWFEFLVTEQRGVARKVMFSDDSLCEFFVMIVDDIAPHAYRELDHIYDWWNDDSVSGISCVLCLWSIYRIKMPNFLEIVVKID